MKLNKHIEIVSSSRITLSSMSNKSRQAILEVLSTKYTRVDVTLVDNMHDLEALVAKKPDLVFLGMKFLPFNSSLGVNDPDKIWLSDYLDQHGIIYTGSNQQSHKLELNKALAKQRVANAGLQTSRYYLAQKDHLLSSTDINLKYPVFIKPANRGGGLGIDSMSVAHDFKALSSKVNSIANQLGADSLIEEYLPGREFSVAVLKKRLFEDYLLMPIELVAEKDIHGQRLLSEDVKNSNNEKVSIISNKDLKASVSKLALEVFKALGAQDYGRIDIRLDNNGTPNFLEANLLPSLIEGYGSFPKACLINTNLSYADMVLRIVELGFKHSKVGNIPFSKDKLNLKDIDKPEPLLLSATTP
jgi:D-alanine-D-alanine ligase